MCDAICGLSLLLVLSFAPRGLIFLRVLRFSPLLKNQHFQIPIRPGSGSRRTTLWMCYLQIIIYLFIHLLCFRSAALRPDHPYSFGGPPDHWPSNQAIRPPQTIRTAPRSDYNRPSSDPTTKSDHPTRSQTTSLDYSASNQHSIPNPLNWYRSGAFFMGWDKGGI